MGRVGGHRPKSLTLIWLWNEHRAALQYDWMRAWHGILDLTRMPLYAAWPMLREILKDHTTHSFALLADWSWIPTDADMILYALSQTGKKQTTPPPWADTTADKPHAKPRDQRLHTRLLERLGITDN